MGGLSEASGSVRLHIGVFGRTNSGKSSFVNAFSGQQVSIASDVAGTTTDPVNKPMEIFLLGACIITDTAGFDDGSALGKQRVEKTRLAAEKSDIGIILFDGADIDAELEWFSFFIERKTPVLSVITKSDRRTPEEIQRLCGEIGKRTGSEPVVVSSVTGEGMQRVREALARLVPEDFDARSITGSLANENDVVMLVMPQDIQAPKGRLILPQVQTIRELLDKDCVVVSVTADKMAKGLESLAKAPKLIITDSQVFGEVYAGKPRESMLTSFSVLFAAYKGDLPYYMEGARALDGLRENARILIAECCTHAPLTEDIGRVKIPRMLYKRFGQALEIVHKSGTDFPADLSEYDLIIQCGACMFNRKYVLSRVERAKAQGVPMTNYGVVIAHLTGILDKVVTPV